MSREIQLTRGQVAVIDDADFDWLSKYRWTVIFSPATRSYYAVTRGGHPVYMHRMILAAKEGQIVDHKDRNTLNNQRSNLRFCSHAESIRNRGKQRRNTSGYVGVVRTESRNPSWYAQIEVDGKHIPLGKFATKEDAAKARDFAAIRYHGEFAFLNFKDSTNLESPPVPLPYYGRRVLVPFRPRTKRGCFQKAIPNSPSWWMSETQY